MTTPMTPQSAPVGARVLIRSSSGPWHVHPTAETIGEWSDSGEWFALRDGPIGWWPAKKYELLDRLDGAILSGSTDRLRYWPTPDDVKSGRISGEWNYYTMISDMIGGHRPAGCFDLEMGSVVFVTGAVKFYRHEFRHGEYFTRVAPTLCSNCEHGECDETPVEGCWCTCHSVGRPAITPFRAKIYRVANKHGWEIGRADCADFLDTALTELAEARTTLEAIRALVRKATT